MTIEVMKNIDPRTVDRSQLVDRRAIRIDPDASREERLRQYIQQIKNPYCYLDGKTVVKITFSKTETTMEDCVAHYLRGLQVSGIMDNFQSMWYDFIRSKKKEQIKPPP